MEHFDLSLKSLISLLEGESDPVIIMANTSALVYDALDGINWAGFYRVSGGELILGPFQGKPACMHIPFTKGVCGAAYTSAKTLIVDDVHKFPGHIACDSASNSEIVIPVKSEDKRVIGLLDVDSHLLSRFGKDETEYLEGVVRIIENIFSNNKITAL